MDGRILSLIWFAALLPVLLLLAVASEAGSRLDARIVEHLRVEIAASQAPILLVGSSITRNAVTRSGNGIADAPHLRIAIGSITAAEILDLLDQGIEPGTKELYVEINPLAIQRNGPCEGTPPDPVTALSTRMRGLGRESRRALSLYVFGNELVRLHEARNLDRSFVFSPRLADTKGAARFCDPGEYARLTALRARAERTGTALALMAFPRPRSYAERLDPVEEAAIRAHFERVARDTGLPLFLPARVWPDLYFADHVHFNAKGRERYMRELAAWRSPDP